MTTSRNTKRDGYPTARDYSTNLGPRIKVTPYADKVASYLAGDVCANHGNRHTAPDVWVEYSGTIRTKEIARHERACYIVTVPGIEFVAVTHSTTEKAEALLKKVGMTRHAPMGRAKLGKKVVPVLTRINSYTEEG